MQHTLNQLQDGDCCTDCVENVEVVVIVVVVVVVVVEGYQE